MYFPNFSDLIYYAWQCRTLPWARDCTSFKHHGETTVDAEVWFPMSSYPLAWKFRQGTSFLGFVRPPSIAVLAILCRI